MNIPQGYKDSAVGIIPQEWEVKQLALLGKIFSGGTPSTDKEEYWGENIMWCTPSDITSISSKYINNTKDRITAMGLKNSSAILLPINSIIVCTRATIGAAAITQVELSTNQGFKNIKPEKCNTEWLYYSMILNQPKLQRLGCGSTFLEVSKRDFERLKLAVPPIGEQRKIAEILGVWDEAIEKQSRLIEKLELRKRALMQHLLTGRTRLPGFTSPWQKCLYSDILKEVKRTMTWDDNEEYDLISVKRRSGGLFHRDRLLGKDIKTKNLRPAKCGDFLISKMQIVHGASGLVTEEFDEMKISGSYIALVARNGDMVDMKFINWYSKTPYFYHQTYVSSYGVHIEKMTFDLESFMSMNIMLPPFPEQKAIAEVLTTADNEISTQRKKLDALRLQKRGLMQQLLTGKTRVKI